MALIQTILLAVSFLLTVDAARILAIFPYPSYSHQMFNNGVSMALAKRGHQVTAFTSVPMNKSISNYTEYSLNHYFPRTALSWSFVDISNNRGYPDIFFNLAYELGHMVTDDLFSNPIIRDYLSPNSTEKFDLIILESAYWDGLFYLSDKLNAPIISITTLPGFAIQFYQMGKKQDDVSIHLVTSRDKMNNPHLVASIPDAITDFSDKMNFWQRIVNLYYIVRQIYEYEYIVNPVQEAILRKHFGDKVPPIHELRNRISMMFMTTHPLLSYPRPMVPTILPIGGMRIGSMNKTLPLEFKNMLDNAKQGFIYFSLGSNIKSTDLKENVMNNLIEVFSELPYLVVWKFEAENLIQKPKNVFTAKWIPQQGVLAHPNIKLYIYQGGLQSTEEAIDCGVPLLGMPIFADQWFNVRALVRKNVALSLSLLAMSKKELKEAIQELILNPRYKENMLKIRELFYDRPQHPLNELIWWTEHVIRHKGLSHLQPNRLPWYQANMLDIFGFFLISLIALIFTLSKLFPLMIRIVRSMTLSCRKTEKVKDS